MNSAPLPDEYLKPMLNHIRLPWENLHGKRTFITGDTGCFDLWLLETFAHANVNRESALRRTLSWCRFPQNPPLFASQ